MMLSQKYKERLGDNLKQDGTTFRLCRKCFWCADDKQTLHKVVGSVSSSTGKTRSNDAETKQPAQTLDLIEPRGLLTLAMGPMIHSESPHKRLRKLMALPMVRIFNAISCSINFGSRSRAR